jgi:hypothetical protein
MKLVTCNRGCQSEGLHWKVIEGKYKLFDNTDLIHICNDGVRASRKSQKIATEKMLASLGISNIDELDKEKPDLGEQYTLVKDKSKDYFSITTTSSGIAVTGDDKNTPIYLPKVAVRDLVKALVEFI